MMKTYLWTQSDSTTGKGVYVIDGEPSFADKTDAQQKASDILFAFQNLEMSKKDEIKLAKKENKVCENLFVSYKNGEGYFISSNYITKDEIGRRITYQFFCETDDIDVAIKELKKSSSIAKRQCDEEELKVVSEIIKKNGASYSIALGNIMISPKNLFWIFLTILLVILLWVNNSNKNDNPKETPKQEINKINPNSK